MGRRVSIIVPVYNSERYLAESIESALSQTYRDTEVIAVNDGSTDDSLHILESYGSSITVIDQRNAGLAGAVNAGLGAMTGRWFKWLSPDDVLDPDAVRVLVDTAGGLPPDTILYSNWAMINERGERMRDFREANFNGIDGFSFNVRMLHGQQINVNTTLIPSGLVERGCIPRSLPDTAAVDYDLLLRAGILYGARFHLVDQNLLRYRVHAGQASHKRIARSLRYTARLRADILQELDPESRGRYERALHEYAGTRGLDRKIMGLGLRAVSGLLPERVSDQVLAFYLNRVRSGR